PGRMAAGGTNDLEYGVHADELMRVDRLASGVRIARKKVGIDAASAVQLRQVDVDLFFEAYLRAARAGTEAGASRDAVRGPRPPSAGGGGGGCGARQKP